MGSMVNFKYKNTTIATYLHIYVYLYLYAKQYMYI